MVRLEVLIAQRYTELLSQYFHWLFGLSKRSEYSLHCWTQQGYVRKWPFISCPWHLTSPHLTSPFSSPSTNLPLAVDHILRSEGDVLYPCSHCSDCTLCAECLNSFTPWAGREEVFELLQSSWWMWSDSWMWYFTAIFWCLGTYKHTAPISHDSGVDTVVLVLHLVAIRLYCNWTSCV